MEQDDVKKILCDSLVESMARACQQIAALPSFEVIPGEVRQEYLSRCITADEKYIHETQEIVDWLTSKLQ